MTNALTVLFYALAGLVLTHLVDWVVDWVFSLRRPPEIKPVRRLFRDRD